MSKLYAYFYRYPICQTIHHIAKKHAVAPKKTEQTNKRPSIPLKLYLG